METKDDAVIAHVTRARPDLVVLAVHPGGGRDAVAFVQDLRRRSATPVLITTPYTGEATLTTWLDCARAVEEATAVRSRVEAATIVERALERLENAAVAVVVYWAARFGHGPYPAPARVRTDGGDDATGGPGE